MVNSDHHCQLNKGGFALAATAILSIVYIICALFAAFWPGAAVKVLGWMLHLVVLETNVAITIGGFFVGLVQIAVYSFICAWLFAWLHNKFSR